MSGAHNVGSVPVLDISVVPRGVPVLGAKILRAGSKYPVHKIPVRAV